MRNDRIKKYGKVQNNKFFKRIKVVNMSCFTLNFTNNEKKISSTSFLRIKQHTTKQLLLQKLLQVWKSTNFKPKDLQFKTTYEIVR